jgi:hypothetical protein
MAEFPCGLHNVWYNAYREIVTSDFNATDVFLSPCAALTGKDIFKALDALTKSARLSLADVFQHSVRLQ